MKVIIEKATSSNNSKSDPASAVATQPTNFPNSVAGLSMSGVVSKKARLRNARKHEEKLRGKIEQAHQAGKRKWAEQLTRLYLMSHDARYVATVRANRELKPHRRVPDERLPEIAANLDPWRGSTEEVVVHFKPKASNEHDFRPIMDFGIENRALQYLVWAALEAQADLHPHQFATRVGRPSAAKVVKDALAAGFCFGAHIDISDCYPSFDGEVVPDLLPLPEEVTRNVLLARHLNMSLGNLTHALGLEGASADSVKDYADIADAYLPEARRGIPQGSAVSPLVIDLLLAPAIPELSGNGTVVVYADDFLVMAREENDAASILTALDDALIGHPAGPLRPRIVAELRPSTTEFEFLGYVFRRNGGEVSVAPSSKNLGKFKYKFSKGLERATRSENLMAKKHRELNHLRRYVRSWTAAFSLWPDTDNFRKKKMTLIDDVVAGPQAA